MKKLIPLLIVGAVGLGACSATSKPPTSPAFVDITTTTVVGYNWALVKRANDNLVTDLSAVSAATSDGDISVLKVQCGMLALGVYYYQGLLPTPNSAFNTDMGVVLNHLTLMTAYCKAGDYSLAGNEIDAAMPYIDKAKADLGG